MDVQAAWTKIGPVAKAPAFVARTRNALDAVSPALAPFAARWDAEADRRAQLRTPDNLKRLMEAQRTHTSARSTAARAKSQRAAARKASKNPLNGARRAAATASRAARGDQKAARQDLAAARASYPATLGRRAAEAHAVHAVPAGIASYLMSTPVDLTLWPAATSAAIVVANAVALRLGRRSVAAPVEEGLTAEERRLVARLDPSFWAHHADERGLSGTVPAPVELTPAGLITQVRLDGRWTPRTFRTKHEEIRALLGARTDLRMEIKPGSHGDRATITLRTRSAADGIELTGWTPGDPWGVDTITGEPVQVPLGRRMLIAGTSGSGKSWSTRALLAEGSHHHDHRLVVIDPKRVEALNWKHRARTAVYLEDVLDLTDELVQEMHERLELVPRGQDVIAISADRPRITVFVDEGAEVIAMARTPRERGTKESPGDPDWSRIMENLRTLARMGRAAEIVLIWATQKPTMDRNGGIDPQISAQITYRAALALSTSGEARTVFGEDATERGWHAHDLPMPGVAMLRSGPKVPPNPINTRAFSPADVIALPDRPIWRRGAAVPASPAASTLRLVKPEPEAVPAAEVPAQTGPVSSRDRVLVAVRDGARTGREVADRTGINKGTVSKAVKALVDAGELLRAEDGSLSTPAGEVSA
ncbi:FtsK/SpoIIIE domain-containing protein [Streptomyces sp. NPDC060194]|uniref:FtsK/SpoIIIE domain-containing protein n=1 Tax=Streptomyces sp. NPDC060194 TaxID=3347069 RepID=UPI00365112C4